MSQDIPRLWFCPPGRPIVLDRLFLQPRIKSRFHRPKQAFRFLPNPLWLRLPPISYRPFLLIPSLLLPTTLLLPSPSWLANNPHLTILQTRELPTSAISKPRLFSKPVKLYHLQQRLEPSKLEQSSAGNAWRFIWLWLLCAAAGSGKDQGSLRQ